MFYNRATHSQIFGEAVRFQAEELRVQVTVEKEYHQSCTPALVIRPLSTKNTRSQRNSYDTPVIPSSGITDQYQLRTLDLA